MVMVMMREFDEIYQGSIFVEDNNLGLEKRDRLKLQNYFMQSTKNWATKYSQISQKLPLFIDAPNQ